MSRFGFTRRARPLLIVLAMAGVAVAVTLLAGQAVLTVAASYLGERLDTVSDDGAELAVASAARLGDAGIPVLVEALGSERESVARAAEEMLRQEVTRWETLPPEQAIPKLSILAESLARRVEQFGPTARLEAAGLCQRILQWPLETAGNRRGRLVDNCQKVFRATTLERRLIADRQAADTIQQVALGGPDTGTQTETELLGIPPLPREDRIHARIGNPHAFEQAAVVPLPDPSQAIPQRHGIGPSEARSLAMRRATLDQQSALAAAEPADASPGSAPADLSTIELIRRLHAPNRWDAAAAETALKRRGFDVRNIELARALYHPDVAVRQELAERLPEIKGINPTAWLLRLAEDDNPGVRLTAMTLLATSSDPRLVEKIERMARRDRDPSVRRQAEQLDPIGQ